MHCVILVRQFSAFLNIKNTQKLSYNQTTPPCHARSVVWVCNTHHSVLGVIVHDIKFGTLGLKCSFYINGELHHSVILGHDFIETHNVTLDTRGKKCTYRPILKCVTYKYMLRKNRKEGNVTSKCRRGEGYR